MIDFGAAAFADIGIGGSCAAQVGGIDRAVGVEHFGMTEGEFGAGGGIHFEADETDHVLGEVEGPAAGFRFGDGFGWNLADFADRIGNLAFQGSGFFVGFRHADVGGLPRSHIGADLVPTGCFKAGVIIFPLHEIG